LGFRVAVLTIARTALSAQAMVRFARSAAAQDLVPEIPRAASNWEAAHESVSTALSLSLVLLEGTLHCGCVIFRF
jgi:hypothetical protein